MTDALAHSSTPTPQADPSTMKRAMAAGIIGHFVEWYDYGIYAYVATTLAAVFYASSDPTAGLLAVFATFAVAFFARPLGGLFFGSLADRIGRQRCLAAVVVLMSLCTAAIGVLPGYATVGVAAPILLLAARILQGFSAGGEIAGAASFINEYAPANKRGLLSSLLPAASATGLLFGAVLMMILTSNLSEDGMTSWGWRVPFLIALPLGAIGLYLRLKIEDTPMFQALVSAKQADPTPLRSSISEQFKWIAVAFGATLTYGVGFYTVMSYMPTYLKKVTDFSAGEMFVVTCAVLLAHITALPLLGALSDRIGRKPVLIAGSLALVVVTYPAFLSNRAGPQHVRRHCGWGGHGGAHRGRRGPAVCLHGRDVPHPAADEFGVHRLQRLGNDLRWDRTVYRDLPDRLDGKRRGTELLPGGSGRRDGADPVAGTHQQDQP